MNRRNLFTKSQLLSIIARLALVLVLLGAVPAVPVGAYESVGAGSSDQDTDGLPWAGPLASATGGEMMVIEVSPGQ
jgi:hypothetical protein